MKQEDYVIWQIEQDDKLRSLINNTYITAQTENIKQMRNLVIQFIVISSGIIGFTIPVFGRTDLIKSHFLLVGGLSELLIVILYGFLHLVLILQKENKGLAKQHDRFNSYLDKPRKSRNKFLSEMTNGNWEKWQEKQQEVIQELGSCPKKKIRPDYALDIIFGAFFIALALIVSSLLITI